MAVEVLVQGRGVEGRRLLRTEEPFGIGSKRIWPLPPKLHPVFFSYPDNLASLDPRALASRRQRHPQLPFWSSAFAPCLDLLTRRRSNGSQPSNKQHAHDG